MAGLILWVAGRAVFLWTATETAQVLTAENPDQTQRRTEAGAIVSGNTDTGVQQSGIDAVGRHTQSLFVSSILIRVKPSLRAIASIPKPDPGSTPWRQLEMADLIRHEDWKLADASHALNPTGTTPLPEPERLAPAPSKWSGALWIAAREGSGTYLAPGIGQLGGSQAGGRVYRTLTPDLALTGRLSTALAAKGAEASAGIALRHGAFAVLAERRFALDSGGRNDWSLTAVAGISDVKLPFGVRLDGYAQGGVVGRDGFVDGALRVERPVLTQGSNRLSVGAGIWGSVQPGVARIDVGPQIVARTVIAGRPFRVSAEWRQRVAGTAAPGSGPVVTLGADF